MNDEFNYLGTWWLPSDPDKKWSGVVTYKPEAGIELELVAKRQDIWFEPTLSNVERVDVIQGEVSQYPHRITLTNVAVNYDKSATARTAVMFSVVLQAGLLLEGNHYDETEDISFESIDVVFSSLGEWMASINKFVKGPWEVPVIFKEAKVNIELNNGTKKYPSLEGCHVHIKPDTAQNLVWYCEIADRIRDLLAFLVGRPVTTTYLSTPTNPSQVLGSQYVRVFRQIKLVDFHPSYDIDFPLEGYDERVAEIARAWFELDEDHRVPFELCLDVINNIHGYKKFEFLALMQALECHHQLYFEREGRKKRKWLTDDGRVRDPTLFERLKDLQDSFPGEINLCDEFLRKAKNTRNYYTHYDPKKRKLAWKDDDLSRSISRLVPFAAYFLYNKINLPDDVFFKPFKGYGSRWLWQRQQPDSPYSEFNKQRTITK